MKRMIMAVVSRDEAQNVLDALIAAGYAATFVESRGGMLRQSQLTLFIAVDKRNDVDTVLSMIREHCRREVEVGSDEEEEEGTDELGRSVTTQLGGAAIFVWELDRIETYGG